MAVKHKDIKIVLHRDKDKNAMTAEEAKQLLGWTEVAKGEDYDLRDRTGARVRLTNNAKNRPFRLPLAKRYMSEHLRGKWALNGETLIIDRHGGCQSCAHRLAGLVLAEQEYSTGRKGVWKRPPTMECIVVYGVHESTADTLDLGQRRTLGDVIYRRQDFKEDGKKVSVKEQRKLASMLSHAVRLVWLRSGGRKISDAPHFPHSEAIEFQEDHPGIVDAVMTVHALENGRGADGRRISKRISPGYAAALLYIAGMAATDPERLYKEGVDALDDQLMDKSVEFWTLFASGANLDAGHPVHVLRELLINIDSQSGAGRDDVVGACVKAMNTWLDDPDKKVKAADIRLKRRKDPETGKKVPAEEPLLGGMDGLEHVVPQSEGGEAEEALDTTRKGSRSEGGWAVGDKCWVQDPDNEHWFGEVIRASAKKLTVRAEDGGGDFPALRRHLYTGFPPDAPTLADAK